MNGFFKWKWIAQLCVTLHILHTCWTWPRHVWDAGYSWLLGQPSGGCQTQRIKWAFIMKSLSKRTHSFQQWSWSVDSFKRSLLKRTVWEAHIWHIISDHNWSLERVKLRCRPALRATSDLSTGTTVILLDSLFGGNEWRDLLGSMSGHCHAKIRAQPPQILLEDKEFQGIIKEALWFSLGGY